MTLKAAPVFPSLYAEGQKGGGYDVRLDGPGIPLFLQFKLAHKMTRKSAMEYKRGLLQIPFYRMHIRASRHSDQHEMLLDLENVGQEVYYTAPAFHAPQELNEAYLNHKVKDRSVWIKPSTIGVIQDDLDHHVAFRLNEAPHFCSKPRLLKSMGTLEEFQGNILRAFQETSHYGLKNENLVRIASALSGIAEKHRHISILSRNLSRESLDDRHPLERIAFYAHVFLDCQLFIIRKKRVIRKLVGKTRSR